MELSSTQILDLVENARQARKFARVPSSNFPVGAALLTQDGYIFGGCNVETSNTLYSICAERTALVKAISEGHQQIVAMAVIADAPEPVAPCGRCRQTLIDFSDDLIVLMATTQNDQIEIKTISELLPHAYTRPK
jgi:cytidine deaminase